MLMVCPEERGKVTFRITLFPSNARVMHFDGLRWTEIQALTVSASLAEGGLVLFSVVGDEG